MLYFVFRFGLANELMTALRFSLFDFSVTHFDAIGVCLIILYVNMRTHKTRRALRVIFHVLFPLWYVCIGETALVH